MLNWNKINGITSLIKASFLIVYLATICFNYLQQQFYLVSPSMKALAKGNNEEVVLKLLKNLINTTQGVILLSFSNSNQNYHETFLDDEGIRDIADVMASEQPLFAEGEDPSILAGSNSGKNKSNSPSKRSDQFAYLEELSQQMR